MDPIACELKLADLRASCTDAQRIVLAEIWGYQRQENKPLPPRDLLQRTSLDQDELLALLEPLGGSVVTWKTSTGQGFELTFAGLLLLPEGEQIADMLTRSVAYLKRRSLEDTKLQVVALSELLRGSGLPPEQGPLLVDAMSATGMSIGLNVGQASSGEQAVQFPHYLDSLSRNATLADFRGFLLGKAFEYFVDGLPVEEHRQQLCRSQLQRMAQTQSVFWFVRDDRLRRLLASDWKEANDVLTVNAYRSCAILCGSVLEGLLLDAFSDIESEARQALKARRLAASPTGKAGTPRGLAYWDLADFLDVAEELGVLEGTNLKIGAAVKDYRNRVHLGRQLRESEEITPSVARIAVEAVRECVRALDSRARRQLAQPAQPAP